MNGTATATTHKTGPLGLRPEILPRTAVEFGDRERQDYNDGGELLASIRDRGILQSLLVLERPGQAYLLLAGGRRFRCAEELDLQEIPCLIATRELDLLEIKTIEMVENLHRKNLGFAEEVSMKAKIHQLMVAKHGLRTAQSRGDDPGWSLEKTAQLLGRPNGREQLRQDIELAAALEVIPELAQHKNKSDAKKAMSLLIREHTVATRAAEVDEKLRTSEDGPKQLLSNAYILGDFFDLGPKLPSDSFDIVELDPDYGMGLLELHESRHGSLSHQKEHYHEWEPKQYKENLCRTLAEAYRCTKDGGWLLCWFTFEHFATTFQCITDAGYSPARVPAIWTKPSSHAINPTMLLASGYDAFFYARKGAATLSRPGTSNIYASSMVPPARRIHPTEKPVELYEAILSTFVMPGARMLVPMAGSGNQLLAAANLKIQGVGYDLGKGYKDGYTIRVFDGEYGHYKSLATA